MNLSNQLLPLLNAAASGADTNLDAVPVPAQAMRSIANGTLTWADAMQFLGVGLVIVFTTLVGLWLVCELMGLFFKHLDSKKAPPAAKAIGGQAKSALPAASSQMSAQPAPPSTAITSVITAAVAAALDNAPHRIVSIQEVAPATDVPLAVFAAAAAVMLDEKPHRILSVRPADTTWSRAGRQEQLAVPLPAQRWPRPQ